MVKVTVMSAKDYWLSFNNEWDRLEKAAYDAGQDGMAAFFGELADDAADVWAGLYGPIQ